MNRTLILAALAALLWLAAATPAHADCEYQGRIVPTGTNIGGFVCQADGTWK